MRSGAVTGMGRVRWECLLVHHRPMCERTAAQVILTSSGVRRLGCSLSRSRAVERMRSAAASGWVNEVWFSVSVFLTQSWRMAAVMTQDQMGLTGVMSAMVRRCVAMRTTLRVWRMRPPCPSEEAGWCFPVVEAGMVQKHSGAAARVRWARRWRPGSVMRSSSAFSCVFMGF